MNKIYKENSKKGNEVLFHLKLSDMVHLHDLAIHVFTFSLSTVI